MHKLLATTSLLAAAILAAPTLRAEAHVYEIDTVHSTVGFKVRHLLSKVGGSFATFSGTIKLHEDDLSKSYAEASIDITTIDTNNSDRDKHLQQDDYFNTSAHPTMTFKSTKWEAVKDKAGFYKVHGDLSMNGQTHPVTFTAEFVGKREHPQKKVPIVAFSATGEIDRSQWGVSGGQGVVGNDVDFEIDVVAHQKK
ncbi:MAG: YceI family protein [Opitutales bacterium]